MFYKRFNEICQIITKCNAHIPFISCFLCVLLLNNCNEFSKNTSVAFAEINALPPLSSFGCLSFKDDQEISLTAETDSASANKVPRPTQSQQTCQTIKTRQVVDEFMEQLERIKGMKPQDSFPLDFPAREIRFVRVLIHETSFWKPNIDEFEIYGPDGKHNLALASRGAVATACSTAGWAKTGFLNDGRYGRVPGWSPADNPAPWWVQVQLPATSKVARVVISRNRLGSFAINNQSMAYIPKDFEVLLSPDGQQWTSVARWDSSMYSRFFLRPQLHLAVDQLPEKSWDGLLKYALHRERSLWSQIPADDHLSPLVVERPAVANGEPYWGRISRFEPLERVLVLFEEMIARFGRKGLDVRKEQVLAEELRQKASQEPDSDELYFAARQAKRDLFFRDPALATIERVLFVKRYPYLESHNYSEHLDGILEPGGGVYVLHIPRDKQDRFRPEQAKIVQLFDGRNGIAREPVSDFKASTIYFAYRPDKPLVEGWDSYWHMYSMKADGSDLRKLTDGPFHDFDAVCLPDGGLAFHSTRCKLRFLCWRPQAYVLHRMEADGSNIQRLSYANLTEWKPSVMQDGRILWTRSEYLDKGADFGHTLWAIRPDGTHPELIFGNNTPNCYGQAHEVPGTNEIIATLMTHGGHSGPVALIDRNRNMYDTDAITNITPDVRPLYEMDTPSGMACQAFRDPYPISSDLFLVAHNPAANRQHYGLYVIDRYGNRELLYVDPGISSFFPRPLRERERPPLIPGSLNADLKAKGLGRFTVQDVYMGLGPEVARGKVKYIRVSEELPAILEKLSDGQYRADHDPFTDFYASPYQRVYKKYFNQPYLTRTTNAMLGRLRTNYNWTDNSDYQKRSGPYVEEVEPGLYKVMGGWGRPSYEAKKSHGTVPVAEDGSANFLAPAGKVLYFHLLDVQYNEIQRMRSVIQLQPGEIRSCIGCHEDRQMAPLRNNPLYLRQEASLIEPDPWGAEPFSYQKVVQPVLNKNCVRCHDGSQPKRPVLTGELDQHRIPASYHSLMEGGYVHYFDWDYSMRHFKAEPLSFGTLQSNLWTVLEDCQHLEVKLKEAEIRALKAWIDLNCPLWPDYNPDRPVAAMSGTTEK